MSDHNSMDYRTRADGFEFDAAILVDAIGWIDSDKLGAALFELMTENDPSELKILVRKELEEKAERDIKREIAATLTRRIAA